MNKSKVLFYFPLIFLLSSSFAMSINPGKQKIMADKKKSEISYTMVHPLHEWTGTSKDVNCVMMYNIEEGKIESVAVSVPLSTFDSKNSNRDSHALEVLDAIKYPAVKFTSNSIQQNGDELTINGNMTFHNITKPVTVLAKQTTEKKGIMVEGTFVINITDYQIETPSLMGVKTKEEMGMNFKIVFPLQ